MTLSTSDPTPVDRRPAPDMRRLRPLWRLSGYVWAAPNSLLGLCLGAGVMALGGRVVLVDGTLEFQGGRAGRVLARWPVIGPLGAMTLGHVILATSAAALDALRDHERVHVRQYERWGPLFLPAYALSSLWQLAHGRCPYRQNIFERQAYGADPAGKLR